MHASLECSFWTQTNNPLFLKIYLPTNPSIANTNILTFSRSRQSGADAPFFPFSSPIVTVRAESRRADRGDPARSMASADWKTSPPFSWSSSLLVCLLGSGDHTAVLLLLLAPVLQQVGQLGHLALQDIWRLSLTQDDLHNLSVGSGPTREGNGTTLFSGAVQRRLDEDKVGCGMYFVSYDWMM